MSADTYIDEVAMQRAISGDRGVIASLTPVERNELLARVHERRLAELAENAEWAAVKRVARLGGAWKGSPSMLPYPQVPQWLEDVIDATGYKSCESFMRAARRAAGARG